MEIFKDVKGYEGIYKVSNLGNIKSLARFKVPREKILKGSKDKDGYFHVRLSKNGNVKTTKIHKLVAIAFLGHVPNGMKIQVDHINGISTDNRAENLQLLKAREHATKTYSDKRRTSKYIGVCWLKNRSKWIVSIRIGKERKHLGVFKDELEASNAYQLELSKQTIK